jgi:asparagine synthase (glutamine-hydrolysing)
MCGICGLVDFRGDDSSLLARQLAPVAAALAHRGPDGTRLAGDETAVLGACRLTIRGPGSGLQPLAGISGALAVCNGEIDNHWELRRLLAARGREVQGASDVDILPALYEELGASFVSKLEGAFALAVWDPNRRQLLLARDRAGERPLFFARDRHRFAFASEIGALLRTPWISRELDDSALGDYFRRGYFPSPTTPFRHIRKVGPAEAIVVDAVAVSRDRFWRWQLGENSHPAASLAEFDTLLREAVRRQTDNDVPYGMFLSGGLDSSLIGAIASRSGARPPSRAYTIRFSEPSYDEGGAARRVARLLDLPLTEVWVEAEQFPPTLDRLCRVAGEPLADPAWVPTALLAEVAARTVRVTLVGEGADEIFGGYPTYLGIAVADALARLPRPIVRWLRTAVAKAPRSDDKVPLSLLLQKLAEGLELRGLDRHLFWNSWFSEEQLARVRPVTRSIFAGDSLRAARLLDDAQRFDFEHSLAEGLLTKADRAAMLSALELRAPYLDVGILEWSAKLEPGSRAKGLASKIFLKQYARTVLPAGVVNARKRGLSVPVSRWLRGRLREFARDSLDSARLAELGIERDVVGELFSAHLARRADYGRPLWTLIVLSRWLDQVAAPATPTPGELPPRAASIPSPPDLARRARASG